MTEEIQEPQEEVQEEAPQETQPEPLSEIEVEAQKYGWRPKADFDRDPENWVDAEKFMTFPTTQNRILKDEISAMKSSVEDTVSRRVSAVESMLKQANEDRLAEQQREFDRQLSDIRSQQRQAVEEADITKFDQLERQAKSLKAPEAPSETPGIDPRVQKYREDNAWTRDPLMWATAVNAIGNNPTGLSVEEQISLGERAVRERFPEKFETPKPPRQRVDAGGLGGASKKTKEFSDLPPEAQKQGREFVEDGIFKSKEDYAKSYFAHLEG